MNSFYYIHQGSRIASVANWYGYETAFEAAKHLSNKIPNTGGSTKPTGVQGKDWIYYGDV